MILNFHRHHQPAGDEKAKKKKRRNEPNDGGLDDVFAVLINCFQDVGGLGLDFSLDRQIEVDADLLGFEVYEEKEEIIQMFQQKKNQISTY
jgi:hypothetical protein